MLKAKIQENCFVNDIMDIDFSSKCLAKCIWIWVTAFLYNQPNCQFCKDSAKNTARN